MDVDINNLIRELIRRFINVLIGDVVRAYMDKNLIRINTVAPRAEIAVKPKKKR